MSVIKAINLDLSKISFSDVKTDNHGRKMVYVNYNGGKIVIQTPKMYVPNGIKRWRKKDAVDNKDDSFELELSFGGEDKEDKNSMEIREFHNKLESFDELVKKNIMNHSKEWLGKTKISMDSIEEAFYSPSVRLALDKDGNVLDYPSRVRVKLDRERDQENDSFTGRFLSNKRFKTPVLMFDDKKELLDINESNFDMVVPKGSQVVAVLELVYLSISTKVSAKWKLVQAKVYRNQKTITGYAMLDDSDADQQVDDLDTDETAEEEVVEEVVEEDLEQEVEEDVKPSVTSKVSKPRAKRGVQA
jgi:hypothetical protein